MGYPFYVKSRHPSPLGSVSDVGDERTYLRIIRKVRNALMSGHWVP